MAHGRFASGTGSGKQMASMLANAVCGVGLLSPPGERAVDDGGHGAAAKCFSVERGVAAAGKRQVDVVRPTHLGAEDGDVGRAPGASVPRPRRKMDSGPVVNSSTRRASVILPE